MAPFGKMRMITKVFCITVAMMPTGILSFLGPIPLPCPRHSYGRTTVPLISLGSTPNAKEIDADILTKEDQAQGGAFVSKPAIHYTVPGFKVGWQDSDGNWFDEDGPRNGPPQNYWRQSADEREYDDAMEAVDAVVAEYDVKARVAALEKKNSARKPLLSRKILGRWAPLMLSGERVAFNDKPIDYEGMIEVPFFLDISRANGRRFGKRNHYGVFDLKLESGEELMIFTVGGRRGDGGDLDFGNDISVMTTAQEENESIDLGKMGPMQLRFGAITFISDYVMIQRSPVDGAIDFFLRVDKSYLGASDDEMKRYHLI